MAAGTVSLALGANNDDSDNKARKGFRNTQFLITTGPGPVPSLDGENIVFGRCVILSESCLCTAVVVLDAMPGCQGYNMTAGHISSLAHNKRCYCFQCGRQ